MPAWRALGGGGGGGGGVIGGRGGGGCGGGAWLTVGEVVVTPPRPECLATTFLRTLNQATPLRFLGGWV